MKFGNDTDHEKSEEGCAVEVIFENHHLLLCAACIFSLILGIPLVLNVLWHLQVIYRVTILDGKISRRLSSDSSGSRLAATVATYCPDRMMEYTKSKSTGGFYLPRPELSPCTQVVCVTLLDISTFNSWKS